MAIQASNKQIFLVSQRGEIGKLLLLLEFFNYSQNDQLLALQRFLPLYPASQSES